MSGRDDMPPYTPPPDTEERLVILKALLSGKPVERRLDLHRIARKTERYQVEDLRLLVTRVEEYAGKRKSGWTRSPRIGIKDFERALPHVRPSYTLKMKDEYERWKLRQELKEVIGERGPETGPVRSVVERKVLLDIALVGVPLSGLVDTRLLAHRAEGAGEDDIERIVDEAKLISVRRNVEAEKEAAEKLATLSEAEKLRLFLAGKHPYSRFCGVSEQDLIDAIRVWAGRGSRRHPSEV